METIGIYGGSFNPPHIGHYLSAAYALQQIPRVIVIPCADHAFGKNLEPFEHRYRMCLQTFAGLSPKVEVSNIEHMVFQETGRPSYMIDTIRHVAEMEPTAVRFVLIVGEDVEDELPEWYRWHELKEMVEILTLPRNRSILPSVSSTEMRHAIVADKPRFYLLNPSVERYIEEHSLYQEA